MITQISDSLECLTLSVCSLHWNTLTPYCSTYANFNSRVQISIPHGSTKITFDNPLTLSYVKKIAWCPSIRQNFLFGWASPLLVQWPSFLLPSQPLFRYISWWRATSSHYFATTRSYPSLSIMRAFVAVSPQFSPQYSPQPVSV